MTILILLTNLTESLRTFKESPVYTVLIDLLYPIILAIFTYFIAQRNFISTKRIESAQKLYQELQNYTIALAVNNDINALNDEKHESSYYKMIMPLSSLLKKPVKDFRFYFNRTIYLTDNLYYFKPFQEYKKDINLNYSIKKSLYKIILPQEFQTAPAGYTTFNKLGYKGGIKLDLINKLITGIIDQFKHDISEDKNTNYIKVHGHNISNFGEYYYRLKLLIILSKFHAFNSSFIFFRVLYIRFWIWYYSKIIYNITHLKIKHNL